MHLQAQGHQGRTAPTRSCNRHVGWTVPYSLWRKPGPADTLMSDFRLQAVREYISVVFTHQVCGFATAALGQAPVRLCPPMKGGLRAWGEASHFPEDSEHRRVPKIHPTVTEQPPRKRPAFCALRMNAHTLLSTKAWSAAGGQAFPHEPSLKQVLGVFPAQLLRVQRTEHAGPQESPWQVLPRGVFPRKVVPAYSVVLFRQSPEHLEGRGPICLRFTR